MKDKLTITINIAEKRFPLKIERKEEEKIRKAAKMINDTLAQYKQKYREKDTNDYLSMVVLQFATKYVELDQSSNNNKIEQEIENITKNLDEYINNI